MQDTEATMITSLRVEEGARGGVTQLVDLFVDVGVLGDVGVGAGDVGLGLVVVVVGDEVLDGVLGEELLELGAELGGERPVGRQHERRPLPALDDVGHREGLAGAGDAEQRLATVPLFRPARAFDRFGLVAGGPEIGDDLEVRHCFNYLMQPIRCKVQKVDKYQLTPWRRAVNIGAGKEVMRMDHQRCEA